MNLDTRETKRRRIVRFLLVAVAATALACTADRERSTVSEAETDEGQLRDGYEVAFHTCSMHPSVKRTEPGTCPICSMDLTPVTRQEVETGVIVVDARRRQLIGVRTATVEVRPVDVKVRAVGRVAYDEKRLADVTLKNRG